MGCCWRTVRWRRLRHQMRITFSSWHLNNLNLLMLSRLNRLRSLASSGRLLQDVNSREGDKLIFLCTLCLPKPQQPQATLCFSMAKERLRFMKGILHVWTRCNTGSEKIDLLCVYRDFNSLFVFCVFLIVNFHSCGSESFSKLAFKLNESLL